MANLDVTADKAVRDAVDAFVEGRLVPEFTGETVFETKNSRYRLLDGTVFAAPDDSLVGSELVGWLMESRRRSVVESAWQPGSRAVLVDRHRGRNIIVTSTTRLLHLEEHASSEGLVSPPNPQHRAVASAPLPLSPRHAPIVPATPLPPTAAAVQRRAAAIHLPPRPMAPAGGAPPPPARALPLPAPPPHRPSPSLSQVNGQAPAAGTAWELTSSEFEVDGEATKPDYTASNPSRYDASQYNAFGASEPVADEMVDDDDPSTDTPIPLVRPSSPQSPTFSGRRR
jgi:hypothetical protein